VVLDVPNAPIPMVTASRANRDLLKTPTTVPNVWPQHRRTPTVSNARRLVSTVMGSARLVRLSARHVQPVLPTTALYVEMARYHSMAVVSARTEMESVRGPS